MAHWLLKSEPDSFGIDDLKRSKTTIWDGVRNYQARNYLLSSSIGDLAFFYHSNANPPGIAGLARIVETGVVDPTQFDSESHYYDPRSRRDDPRWKTVKVGFVERFPHYLALGDLRAAFTGDDLLILRKGSRLSVTPVDDAVATSLLKMARAKHGPRAGSRARS